MISFIIPPGHVWQHFPGSNKPGSVFYAQSPAEVLTAAATSFPQIFKDAKPHSTDGRKRLSFISAHDIGLCNVVAISRLTAEELESMTQEERDGATVRTVHTARTFPTREFQIILSNDNTVITMFPGPMAPPLPKNGEQCPFWESHVFVKPLTL